MVLPLFLPSRKHSSPFDLPVALRRARKCQKNQTKKQTFQATEKNLLLHKTQLQAIPFQPGVLQLP